MNKDTNSNKFDEFYEFVIKPNLKIGKMGVKGIVDGFIDGYSEGLAINLEDFKNE